MRMADLKLDEFAVAVKGVIAAMSSRAGYAELVARAAVDTPIIGELMEMLSYYGAFPDGKMDKGDCGAIQRDMVVLLALRHLEQAETVAAN
jgi:hypothetical protein